MHHQYHVALNEEMVQKPSPLRDITRISRMCRWGVGYCIYATLVCVVNRSLIKGLIQVSINGITFHCDIAIIWSYVLLDLAPDSRSYDPVNLACSIFVAIELVL